MSYPLTALMSQLSAGQGPVMGRVVALDGARVVAATPQGRLVIAPASVLAVGDRIVIRDGLAYLSPRTTTVVAV